MDVQFSVSTKLQGLLFTNPEKVFPVFCKEFKAGILESVMFLQTQTAQLTPRNTGNLQASIGYTVQGEGLDLEGTVGTNMSYALVSEEGARPHFPPLGPIELWVKRVGLSLNYTGVELTVKEVAFLVARSISIKGLEAHWMFKKALENSTVRIMSILQLAQDRIVKEIH